MTDIMTLDGSGTETTEDPSKHLAEWHGLEFDGNYDEGGLAVIHDRMHADPEAMAELDPEQFQIHPQL